MSDPYGGHNWRRIKELEAEVEQLRLDRDEQAEHPCPWKERAVDAEAEVDRYREAGNRLAAELRAHGLSDPPGHDECEAGAVLDEWRRVGGDPE